MPVMPIMGHLLISLPCLGSFLNTYLSDIMAHWNLWMAKHLTNLQYFTFFPLICHADIRELLESMHYPLISVLKYDFYTANYNKRMVSYYMSNGQDGNKGAWQYSWLRSPPPPFQSGCFSQVWSECSAVSAPAFADSTTLCPSVSPAPAVASPKHEKMKQDLEAFHYRNWQKLTLIAN